MCWITIGNNFTYPQKYYEAIIFLTVVLQTWWNGVACEALVWSDLTCWILCSLIGRLVFELYLESILRSLERWKSSRLSWKMALVERILSRSFNVISKTTYSGGFTTFWRWYTYLPHEFYIWTASSHVIDQLQLRDSAGTSWAANLRIPSIANQSLFVSKIFISARSEQIL